VYRRFFFLIPATILILLALLSPPAISRAETNSPPAFADSAFDLVNVVNALRGSKGLPAYSISSILMYTAQSQADYMAATGNVTHTGAGGSTVTGRLLAAGYPLAGDLSLGGFRSENIISGGENMSAQDAVNAWTGDAPHLLTMLSPNLTEIGAGVTVTGGRVYYVIDAALPTNGSSGSSGVTPVVVDGTVVPAVEAVIYPVVVSTPNTDGDIFHEVQAGQSLWQIAIDYGVKIDDIKRLNNLFSNDIYPGEKLLIKQDALAVTETPTEVVTVEATASPTLTSVPTSIMEQVTATVIETHIPQPAAKSDNRVMFSVIGIIALALVVGGLFTWLGNTKRE